MNYRGVKGKLERYIDAGFPIIYINSFEERKVDEIIKSAACDRDVLEWNGANGFVDFYSKSSIGLQDSSLTGTMRLLMEDDELSEKILVIKDMHTLLDEIDVVAVIKELAIKINNGLEATIIMVSSVINIPSVLEKYITILEMDYLSTEEIKEVIINFNNENNLPEINEKLLKEMAVSFKGLSQFEIENLIALAYATDGEFTRRDLKLIFEQKQQMIRKSGILEMIPLKESITDIGGLENLKDWLNKKSKVFKNIDEALKFGVDMPKGVLIAGVPGCGKSLNAKAAASMFEVPLVRLDMGRLMGKYVGESESNLRKAIALAEAISPCVLWVDELEKAFAGINGQGGGVEVITRLFGNFLTWMQEKDSPTFVVATANDITNLPPELLRKGRFDEIFYVGLPNYEERKKIFEIHLRKRRESDIDDINLDDLANKSEGYSGADIEGVVKESIESVFVDGRSEVTTNDVLEIIKKTNSLSVIMKEPLKKMAEEYEKRKLKNASKK